MWLVQIGAHSPMTDRLVHNDLSFTVRRSAKRQTISIVIERDYTLTLFAPEATSADALREAVALKEDWVYRKLQGLPYQPSQKHKRCKEFVDGEGFWFLGRHLRLKLVDRNSQKAKAPAVYVSGDRIHLAQDQQSVGLRRFQEFYSREGRPFLNATTARWAGMLGVSPNKYVTVQDLGYHWGSCSSDGTINYHWKVMQLPPSIIDYVAAHELCHLLVPGHSAAFWRQIEKVQPDYLNRRTWLANFLEGI